MNDLPLDLKIKATWRPLDELKGKMAAGGEEINILTAEFDAWIAGYPERNIFKLEVNLNVHHIVMKQTL